MLKSDRWIYEKAILEGMISPFIDSQINDNEEGGKVISYGLSSYGYDIRCGTKFKVPAVAKVLRVDDSTIDPKDVTNDSYKDIESIEPIVIEANSIVLARSVEYFKIPRNVMALCTGKSTYARTGLLVNTTPIEPGWQGYLTMSLANLNNFPLKVYPNEGIAQMIFIEGEEYCNVSYADRHGKYNKQEDISIAKMYVNPLLDFKKRIAAQFKKYKEA